MPVRHDVEEGAGLVSMRALREESAEQDRVANRLVAFVLEVVLGEPEDVVAEGVSADAHVEQPLVGVPHGGLRVDAVDRGWRARSSVGHLDAAEEENSYSH